MGAGSSKRVLVTGASGFIGRHALEPLLNRGYEVHGTSLQKPAADFAAGDLAGDTAGKVTWHTGDLLKDDRLSALVADVKPTHLLHFAWYVEHGKYVEAPENTPWLEASTRMLKSFQANGGRRAVVAGSCFEYDWTKTARFTEKSPLAPKGLYGRSKNELRERLEKIQLPDGSAWGRIFWLYGPGEPPTRLVPVLINSISSGRPLGWFEKDRVRDFIYVKDLGDAFAALLDSSVTGAVNLAQGKSVSLLEIAETIATLVGKPVPPYEKSQKPSAEPPSLEADTTRLLKEVGWKPRYSLKEGLKDFVESFSPKNSS